MITLDGSTEPSSVTTFPVTRMMAGGLVVVLGVVVGFVVVVDVGSRVGTVPVVGAVVVVVGAVVVVVPPVFWPKAGSRKNAAAAAARLPFRSCGDMMPSNWTNYGTRLGPTLLTKGHTRAFPSRFVGIDLARKEASGPPSIAKMHPEPMKKLSLTAACLSSLLLIGCTEEAPTAANKAPEKVEPIGGQSALYKMYQMARTAYPDAKVLKLNNVRLAEVPTTVIGKFGAWQATFVSEAKGKSRIYTYFVVASEVNPHKGPYAGPESGWSGKQGVNTAFDIREVRIESDAAYLAAKEKAADYEAKNPNMPISFQLEQIDKFTEPVWRVIWGESTGTSNYSIYVGATLGKFLERMH